MIEQKDQKLSIQKAKCEEFEIQQNKLMDLFQNVPNEQRNFLGLQENIETLKQDYINEKERADNLAANMLDIPTACDHSKFDEEILKLKENNAKLKKAIGVLYINTLTARSSTESWQTRVIRGNRVKFRV